MKGLAIRGIWSTGKIGVNKMSEFLAEILVLAVAVIAVCKVVELFRGD